MNRSELRALAEAATPGPWRVEPDGWDEEHGARFLMVLGGAAPDSLDEHAVCSIADYGQGDDECEATASLIARLPALLDRLDAAEAHLADVVALVASEPEDAYDSQEVRRARAFLEDTQ